VIQCGDCLDGAWPENCCEKFLCDKKKGVKVIEEVVVNKEKEVLKEIKV
jgi:hypothetical protein